jgi:thiopurine S-methyltransferase
MELKFWRDRWHSNQIGFHQAEFNPWLVKYWERLQLPDASGVFVPMCGKSWDMRWLVTQGHLVHGIELIELAIEAYFEESDEPYQRVVSDSRVSFQGSNTDIVCGDFFELIATDLADISAVFDRGALVALPANLRARYVDHMLRVIPDQTQILLVTLEYDQNLVAGPPFSVLPEEVTVHFEERCSIQPLESKATDILPPKFSAQGVARAVEAVYRIVKER